MRKRLWYPHVKDIVDNNKRVLKIFKATKAEKHEIKGLWGLQPIINESKKNKGDIYDKASILLRGINKSHSFGSANKRTAYFTANEFICKNEGFLVAKKRNKQRDFCVKVREGRVTDGEISDWLKYADKNKKYGRDR